jgi:hypothetical protein
MTKGILLALAFGFVAVLVGAALPGLIPGLIVGVLAGFFVGRIRSEIGRFLFDVKRTRDHAIDYRED